MAGRLAFPAGTLWGAATSAHQVEGNCRNNQWWAWEQEGGHIRDGSVSGLACDHYGRFDEDFRLAASLGHTAQRISVEWSRIEPEEGRFDEGELDHYRAVCDSIRHHFAPLDPDEPADRAEAEARDRFMNQWCLEGISTGRTMPPCGNGEEVPGLAGSFDVLGLNYYDRMLVRPGSLTQPTGSPLALRRPGERPEFDDEMGWEVHPPGLGAQLRRLARFGKPLMVTENGHATLDEAARTRYLHVHLGELHGAIADGVDVRGYFFWSLMDNFEWAEGYTRHFGLVAIEPGTLARRPRPAAFFFRDVIAQNALPALA